MMLIRRRVAALLLLPLLLAGPALLPLATPLAAPPAVPAVAPDPLVLTYVGGERKQKIRIDVELDGRPLASVWDETFHKLFADLDRDGDGFLSREEARRAPSALRVRQLSWGLFFAAPAAPSWEELDRRPADGKVSFEELVDYYHRHGVGGVQVAVGRPPATDALTDALLRRLDRDGDGGVSKAEWQSAAESLHALDLNDDELISGDELVPGLAYPGAFGATLLTPLSPDHAPSSLLDSFPFRRLPGGGEAPDHALVVRLGRRPGGAALLDLGRALCDVRPGDSRLTADFASARVSARQRFAEADADGDGRLSRAEAERSSFAPPHDLFDIADRDGDGYVSAQEWSAYLDLEGRLVEGQVLLTILDHGRGLFEFLDADRDGVLSVRELRSAWSRLEAAGCLRDGALDRSRLPRQLRCVVSRGRPRGGRTPQRRGPDWFRAMDRNGDGDVLRREFLGTDEEFRRLDADGDGLISAEEAERADRSERRQP